MDSTSSLKGVKKQPGHPTLVSTPSFIGDNYNFGYEIGDGDKSHKFHKEVGDENGRKVGSYGFTDADGRQRVVQYVADENGFRVQIKTNEPGANTHEAAASVVQKRPTIVLLDDKDSPMTLPVKTPIKTQKSSTKRIDSLSAASSFHAPVLPNGPVRMYDTGKSAYFTRPASQSIEYKPHPKAIRIGPLLNVIGTPLEMSMQSPILPLGPVKMARYEPAGPHLVPAKYQSPIPITNNYVDQTPTTFMQQPVAFEALRISASLKHSSSHPPVYRKDLETVPYKFDPSKFNILSMYQTTLLPNGPKMYDGPVHAYVRAPPKGPPPNRLVYNDPPRKSAVRKKVVRKKKTQQNSNEGLQTTENGLELSQTIHDQSTVFYVPAEHAPPVRRRLAKPIFKKKRQPLQHGDGTPAQELQSPLTGSKPVVYDDPVGDLKPVPLFKGSSVTGFLPPSGKLFGPSESYRLVRPPVAPSTPAGPSRLSHLPLVENQPLILVQHQPPPASQIPDVIHKPTPQLSASIPPSGLVAQNYQGQVGHLQPEDLYQARLEQPPPAQYQSAHVTSDSQSLKIPSYPKLTEIERAAALKLAEQPLHVQPPLRKVPLQVIQNQKRPALQTHFQPRYSQQHVVPEAIQQVPAPNLSLHRQPKAGSISQIGIPSVSPQAPLHEYFFKQAPTFLQNQEAIVNKFTKGALTVSAPRFEQHKTTVTSFNQAKDKPLFPHNRAGPPQVLQQSSSDHSRIAPPQLTSQPYSPSPDSLPPSYHDTPGIHPRAELPYHRGPPQISLLGVSPQPQPQVQPESSHTSRPPDTLTHPTPSVSAPHLQHFTLPNSGPLSQTPNNLQDVPPINPQQHVSSITPSPQAHHILINLKQYQNPPQLGQSLFPSPQVSSGPPHPSQHLPAQVLPPHYHQPPATAYQPQQTTQQHPPQLLHASPQHLTTSQQVAGPPRLPGGRAHTLQMPLLQQLHPIPTQNSHEGAPSPQHLLPADLKHSPLSLSVTRPEHLLRHGQPSEDQRLPQSLSQHTQPHRHHLQSTPPSQLLHSDPSQSVVPHLGSHLTQSIRLQHQAPQLLQSQPLLQQLQGQPPQVQLPPQQFQEPQAHSSLQPQASFREKTTHTLVASPRNLQVQAFTAEPRQPKSLADHSPFEYIKKSSR
ncbi:cuticular protein-like [Tropilaelaps mercedesae]|uniref:Cuticular protein-like n=1 Tax=Tropilaelaps mercedesae TaxID=418985 RepID=A0A1V9X8U4_9ACAR|nr:cuticular protein-like [Tropilaelaps mercedesae]